MKSAGPWPDPDIGPLGGTNSGEGSRGQPRPLWVQGKALVGGSGGQSPRSKTIFSILNGFGELSFIMFLAYFSSLEYREMCLTHIYACNIMYKYA